MLAYVADHDEKGGERRRYLRAIIPRIAGTTSVSATAPNSDRIRVISIRKEVPPSASPSARVVPKQYGPARARSTRQRLRSRLS